MIANAHAHMGREQLAQGVLVAASSLDDLLGEQEGSGVPLTVAVEMQGKREVSTLTHVATGKQSRIANDLGAALVKAGLAELAKAEA